MPNFNFRDWRLPTRDQLMELARTAHQSGDEKAISQIDAVYQAVSDINNARDSLLGRLKKTSESYTEAIAKIQNDPYNPQNLAWYREEGNRAEAEINQYVTLLESTMTLVHTILDATGSNWKIDPNAEAAGTSTPPPAGASYTLRRNNRANTK